MKKLHTIAAFMLLVISCQKNDINNEEIENSVTSDYTLRHCAAQEVLEQQLAADPKLRQRMQEIENFIERKKTTARLLSGGTIEIPVVVHVLYNKSAENISQAQIQSQIAVLNEDFHKTNSDRTKVPSHFTDEQTGSDMPINFVLQQVIRKKTNKKSWGTNDAMKKSSMGGSDAVNPTTTLNIWVCNLGRNLLGYAQFPGGDPKTDGIVVLYSAFGSRAKEPGGTYVGNYDLGRTATHELGHWLNLRHIWGDATCGNDFVFDTPVHNTANYGCPSFTHTSTCNGGLEMWMNYMDYTYDACMYMFTAGQRSRVEPLFISGGARYSFAQP